MPSFPSLPRIDAIQFVARDLPGLGYRTYVAADAPAPGKELAYDTQQHTLSGPHFVVEIDPARGAIRALTDTRTGRQWVDSTAPQAFGQYLYERFDRDQVAAYVKAYVKIDAAWALNELGKPDLPPAAEVPYQALTPTDCQVRYEESPIAVSAIIESAPNDQLRHALTTRVTLYRDLPCVDLELTLHDKPADSWPEAGWICLPVRASKPQFRLGRLGSIVDPVCDLVPGSNHNLYGLNTGLAVVDESGDGLGICALDSPLVSLGPARVLEVRPGVRAPTIARLCQPVQQPVDDELSFLERGDLDIARASLAAGRGKRGPIDDRDGLGGPVPVAGCRG